MKKEYSKPYMVVESFQLNAAIAASCSSEEKTPLNFYQNNCTLEEEAPGLVYFGAACAGNGVDVTNPDFVDDNGTLCYHGPIHSPNDLFMCS